MPVHLTGSSILIVEDDALLQKRLKARLEALGADVTVAGTLMDARGFIRDLDLDFALLDVHLPDGLSTDLLKEKVFSPNTMIVVMTAHGAVDGAVQALQLGALDYLVKPFDPAELPLVLERARRQRQSHRVEEHSKENRENSNIFFGSALQGLKVQLEKILEADRRIQGALPPVLIQGATGTGKTTMARWLHAQGPRAAQSLVEVNCSALPESLAESELFGHERGAFTDARTARMGLFEAAHGGSLFLDELPSLSLPLQTKILTAIEDRHIRRVGGNKRIEVDVRIIAATNQDLKEWVAQGKFREDLYHRLDLYRIVLPSLHERGADILELAEQIIQGLCRRHRLPRKKISELGRHRLVAYAWPGNVRELAHELERAIVFEESSELDFPHLASEVSTSQVSTGLRNDWLNESALFENFSLEDAIDRLIEVALHRAGGNVSGAARLLNVPRDYIRYRQKKKKPPKTGE